MSIGGMNPRWKVPVKAVQFAQTQFHLSLVGWCSRALIFITSFPHVPAGVRMRMRSDLLLRAEGDMKGTKGGDGVVGWWAGGGGAYLVFSRFEKKLPSTVQACEGRLTSTCKAAPSGTRDNLIPVLAYKAVQHFVISCGYCYSARGRLGSDVLSCEYS